MRKFEVPQNFWKWTTLILLFIASLEALVLLKRDAAPSSMPLEIAHSPEAILKLLNPRETWDLDSEGEAEEDFENDFQFAPSVDGLGGPQAEDHGREIWLTFNISGDENADIQVKIVDQQILMTIQSKNSKPGNVQMEFSHTQLFPLPRHADPMGFQIKREPGRFIIIFKKLSESKFQQDDQPIDV